MLTVELKHLFTTPVYSFDLLSECEGLVEMVAMDGQNFSNYAQVEIEKNDKPFKSKDYNFLNYPGYGTEKLKQYLAQAIDVVSKDRNWPKCHFEFESRHNVYPPNEDDSPHFHSMPDLVGVFYLNVPDNSGDILFFDTRGVVGPCWKDKWISTDGKNRNDRIYHRVTPKPGQLILFPSYLNHAVETNLSDTYRLSVVIDIRMIADE